MIHLLTADGKLQGLPDPLILVVGQQAYEVRTTGRGRLVMFPVRTPKGVPLGGDRDRGDRWGGS